MYFVRGPACASKYIHGSPRNVPMLRGFFENLDSRSTGGSWLFIDLGKRIEKKVMFSRQVVQKVKAVVPM
jgi:hypothetical protein